MKNTLQVNPNTVLNLDNVESITMVTKSLYTIKMCSGATHSYVAKTYSQQQQILRLIAQG